MRYTEWISKAERAFLVAACWGVHALAANGQSVNEDLVYRFTLEGISDPVAAKHAQYELMSDPLITSCIYVDDCLCFKMGSTELFDLEALTLLLAEHGHLLVGDVDVSNGMVLRTIEPIER